MSDENTTKPLYILDDVVVSKPFSKWKPILEASIPLATSLGLPDDKWHDIKLSIKKRPDGTVLVRSVSVFVRQEETWANEGEYMTFKMAQPP